MRNVLLKELKFFASSLNILIVEEDIVLKENLIETLKTFFKHVDSASNGLDALKLYKSRKYDIVLTDINIPKMNGLELCREIKAMNKEQCILVLSAVIDNFVIDLIDIAIHGLILKPFDFNKFANILSRNCENIVLKREFKRSKFKIQNKNELINTSSSKTFGIENLLEKTIKEDLKVEKNIEENIGFFNQNSISWDIIEDDIKEYNIQMEEVIDYIMLYGVDKKHLIHLSEIFRKYYSSLILLDNLEDFSCIFEDIAEYFYKLNLNEIPEDKLKEFDTYLYIYDDLINFFDVAFIKKDCQNINYLTDSLKSSVAQMKYSLSGVDLQEEEFELF